MPRAIDAVLRARAAAFGLSERPSFVAGIEDATILDVNPAMGRLVGRSADALIGRPVDGLLDGGDGLRRLMGQPRGLSVPVIVLTSGDSVGADAVVADAGDEHDRLALVQLHPRTSPASVPLPERERRFQDVIDNVSALVYVKRPDGRFLLVNRYFAEKYGIRRDEAPEKTSFDYFPPEIAAVYATNDRKVLETGVATHFEEPNVDGGAWLSLKFPLFDDAGHPYAVGGISTDISERHRAAEAVRREKEAAERANREKSELLSRISHELRTPLNAILGFGHLLALDDLPPASAATLDRILMAGDHLLALIDDVLSISMLDAGGLSLAPRPVHACDPLSEAVMLVRLLASERGVDLRCDMHGGLYQYVQADYQRLKQVLLNLLTNAIKYNRDNGSVAISMARIDGELLRFRVADTGIGLHPRNVEAAFRPFERLGADETDVEGSGLGLTLSKALVDAMGGEIGVESTSREHGTTFFVDLPLVDVPIDPAAAFASRPSAMPEDLDLGPARVLYIEDNLANLEVTQRLLQHLGDIEMVPALRAHAGLELAQREAPDLILLDLHLPDLSGHEVLQRLKEDRRTCDIPVIIVSADATAGQVERLERAGALAYLTKPLDFRGFASAVALALGPPG